MGLKNHSRWQGQPKAGLLERWDMIWWSEGGMLSAVVSDVMTEAGPWAQE